MRPSWYHDLARFLVGESFRRPDPYDPEMFIANAEDYVKRFRNHASIGIYCGRNEGFPPEQIDKALRRIVKEDHPGLHYISSSADEVVSGHTRTVRFLLKNTLA